MRSRANRSDVSPRVAATLAEITEVLEAHFRENVLSDDPHADAEAVVAVIAEQFGGRAFYLPRGDSLRRAQRDHRIRADRRAGSTIDELGTRYRLSTRQIRCILERN